MLSAEALNPMAKVSIQAMCGAIIQELRQQSSALPFRLDEKQARYFSTSSEVDEKCCRYMQDCKMRVKMGCHDGTVVHLKVSPQQEKTAALEIKNKLVCQSGDPAQIAGYFIHFKKATSRNLRAKARQINSKLKKHCRAHLDQKVLETALRMTARPSRWKRTLHGAIRGMKNGERDTFLNELSKVLSTHLKSHDGDGPATNMKDILADLKRTGQATASGPLWKQELDSAAGVATASSVLDRQQIQHLTEQKALKNPKLGQVSVQGPDGHLLTAHVAPDKNGGSNVFLIEKTDDAKKNPAWNSKCTVLGGLAQCQYNKNPAKIQLGSDPVTGALQVSSSYSMTAQVEQNQDRSDVQHTSANFKTIHADGQKAPNASAVSVSNLAQAKTGATDVSVIGLEVASDQSAANNSAPNAQSQTHVTVAGSSRGDKLGVGALINGHIQSTDTADTTNTADNLNKGADTQINVTYFGDANVFNNQWKRTCDGQTQCTNTFMETATGTLHKTKTANLSDNVNFAVSPDAQNLSTSGGLTRSHTIASNAKDGPSKTQTTGFNLSGTNDRINGITSESLSLSLGLAKQLHHSLSKTTSASNSNSKTLNLTGQLNQNPTGQSTTLSGEIALPQSLATENSQFKSRSNASKSNSIRVASTFDAQKLQEIDLSWKHLNTRGINENQFQKQASFAVGLNDNLEFHSAQGQVGVSCTAVDESTGQVLSNSPYRMDAILNGDWSANSYGASIKISGPLGARVRCGQ